MHTATGLSWYTGGKLGVMMSLAEETFEKRALYAVAGFYATALLAVAAFMAANQWELNKNVAILLTKIDNHEVRLHDVEKHILHEKH